MVKSFPSDVFAFSWTSGVTVRERTFAQVFMRLGLGLYSILVHGLVHCPTALKDRFPRTFSASQVTQSHIAQVCSLDKQVQ